MATVTQKARRAYIHTHGCRLNQAESEMLSQQLVRAGYSVSSSLDKVDLAIINTCTVTREAEAKCRQTIRKIIRHNPNAFVAVIGCYSQTGASALAAIEGVDLIVGNQDKMKVLDYVHWGKHEQPLILREQMDRRDFSLPFVGELPSTQRAYLKIQDGCNFMCSFCLIPFARGRARSRYFNNVIAEARTLVANNVKELVLTGVNIGTFSSEGQNFLDLVEALASIPGLQRIRISSIEPTTIPKELFTLMADDAHPLLPYLHIPLQSGSDAVLQSMRRRYSVQDYLDFIEEADEAIDGLCLGSDIMVGYPNERSEDFEESCDVFQKSPLAYCHVFSYSERPGTLAPKKDNSVPVAERNRRSAYLRRLSAKKRYDFNQSFLGQTMEVLFETQREGFWSGYTGNYIRVLCKSEKDLTNSIASVSLTSMEAEFAIAKLT